MLIKIDRYRVRPDQLDRHQAIQTQVEALYRRLIHQPCLLLRSQDDPCRWVSIHWYPDEAAYHRRMKLMNAAPEAGALWQALQSTLDPNSPHIEEEYYDPVSVEVLLNDD